MRLRAVLPVFIAPWVAMSTGAMDPVKAGLLTALAAMAGRSTIRHLRVRLR